MTGRRAPASAPRVRSREYRNLLTIDDALFLTREHNDRADDAQRRLVEAHRVIAEQKQALSGAKAVLRDLLEFVRRQPNATAMLAPGSTGAGLAAAADSVIAAIEGGTP